MPKEGERIEFCLPTRTVTELEQLAASNRVSLEQVTAMLIQGALGLLLERRLERAGRWRAYYERRWRRRNPEKARVIAVRWRAKHSGYSTRYWQSHRAEILRRRKLRGEDRRSPYPKPSATRPGSALSGRVAAPQRALEAKKAASRLVVAGTGRLN